MNYTYIDSRTVGGVLIITMNDQSTRNAISICMAEELNIELGRFNTEPGLRALVLTGREPSFCSGANVHRMDQANIERSKQINEPRRGSPWDQLERCWQEDHQSDPEEMDVVRYVPLTLSKLQKPSIAAVNGPSIGLGMGVALSCDIRIASSKAIFSEAFVKNGLVPADGSCWQLPRIIGLSNTLLLQYTGDKLSANDALRLGIVSQVVPHEELEGAAMDLAQRLACGPTYAMALTKKLVQQSLSTDFEESMKIAGPAQKLARQSQDHQEGVRAFIEKRLPNFKGQ